MQAGLPIRPERCERLLCRAETAGSHACFRCGHVQSLATDVATTACAECQNEHWLPVSTAERAG